MRKILFQQMGPQFLVLSALIMISSCAKKSDTQDAQGDLQVQIGVQTSESEYSLQQVTLKNIFNLKEVSGAFAKFFYAPGSTETELTGSAPHANFIRTNSFFVPVDVISMQMATIYYHMQNLAQLDKDADAENVNQWPRSVGLETQILDQNSSLRQNNAFYNGQTDSMMFVPFTADHLPITMNAGIIAHEHFHSLFYKIVIKPAAASNKILSNQASIHSENDPAANQVVSKMQVQTAISDKERAQVFNETYLRGLNEGLADFWGWVYTEDPEFMRWSLPAYQANRTLQLQENQFGQFENKENILNKINELVQFSKNPKEGLIDYAYVVGTPFARFLKHLATKQSEIKKITVPQSKLMVAKLVIRYLNSMVKDMNALKENETLNPSSLFEYVLSDIQSENPQIKVDLNECHFLEKYIDHVDCAKIIDQNTKAAQ